MADKRKGRQTPTESFALPYSETLGLEAAKLYNPLEVLRISTVVDHRDANR